MTASLDLTGPREWAAVAGGGTALVLWCSEGALELLDHLDRSPAGQRLLADIEQRYDVVIDPRIGESPVGLVPPDSRWTIDAIAVGPVDPTTTDQASAAVRRRLVRVVEGRADHEAGDWEQVFTVGPGSAGVRNTNVNHLLTPEGGYGLSVLGVDAVARVIAGWLSESSDDLGLGLTGKLETDFVVLDASITVATALTVAAASTQSWMVVRATSPAAGSHNCLALKAQDVVGLSERGASSKALLGEVLDFGAARTVALAEAVSFNPPMTTPAPWLKRQVVVQNASPVGVVPGFDDSVVELERTRWLSIPAPSGSDRTDEPTRVKQHLRIEGPDLVQIGQEAAVKVQVSGRADENALDGLSAMGSTEASTGSDLVIDMVARGSIELVDARQVPLKVQGIQEIFKVDFAIRGLTSGPGSVAVTLRQGSDDLIALGLPVIVTGSDRQPEPQSRHGASDLRNATRHHNQLRVLGDPLGTSLHFSLALPGLAGDTEEHVQLRADHMDQLRQIHERLVRMYTASPSHRSVLDDELVGVGRQIFKKFVPPKLAEILWEHHHELRQLELISDVPAILWEAACLQSPKGDLPAQWPFLAERGLTRRLHGISPVTSLRLRRDQRYVVAPMRHEPQEDVRGVFVAERDQVAGATNSRITGTNLLDLTSLLEAGEFDLLHFVGHASADFDDFEGATLMVDDSYLEGGRVRGGGLSSRWIAEQSFDRQHPPFVFLNACETGRLGSDLSGFAPAFMQAGAGAFVGAQWAIHVGPAKDFATAFYREFLADRRPLAEAISTVRSDQSGDWSANRLAYVAYGDPEATIAD